MPNPSRESGPEDTMTISEAGKGDSRKMLQAEGNSAFPEASQGQRGSGQAAGLSQG